MKKVSSKNYNNYLSLFRVTTGKIFLIFIFILLGHSENAVAFMQAQGNTVTGTITDSNGIPLPGVNVIEEGTSNGTQTDFDGNYSIEVSSNDAVLVYSFIGMIQVERIVGSQNVIDVAMETDQATLDEVVVVGYGTQKKFTSR